MAVFAPTLSGFLARRTEKIERPSVNVLAWRWSHALDHYLRAECGINYRLTEKVRASKLLVFRLRLDRANDLDKLLKASHKVGLALGTPTPRIVRNGGHVDWKMNIKILESRGKELAHGGHVFEVSGGFNLMRAVLVLGFINLVVGLVG